MSKFIPEYTLKMEGRALATFSGPKTAEHLSRIFEFVRLEKWRGQLRVDFGGNGGVSNITFDEVRRITRESESATP